MTCSNKKIGTTDESESEGQTVTTKNELSIAKEAIGGSLIIGVDSIGTGSENDIISNMHRTSIVKEQLALADNTGLISVSKSGTTANIDSDDDKPLVAFSSVNFTDRSAKRITVQQRVSGKRTEPHKL